MKKELDIDMYIDGFDAKKINCVHSPIAAAAGYFERNYYFYYCFLYSLINFYDINSLKYREDFFYVSNNILSSMGLSLQCIEYNDDYDMVLNKIKFEISNNNPVIVICKYNTLFYNPYYGTDFFPIHGIIVSGFNNDNDTIIINESTLLKTFLSQNENPEIFFPLQITCSSLKDILHKSNSQFKNIEAGLNYFENKIFYLKYEKNLDVSTYDIINKAIFVLKNMRKKKYFIDTLNEYSTNSCSIKDIKLDEFFSRYVWGIYPIFKLLHMHVHDDIELDKKVSSLEKELIYNKQITISTLTKYVIKKQNIPEYQRKAIVEEWEKDDLKLLKLLKKLSKINMTHKYKYLNIDILSYYNCRAFEESISDESLADLTGEGTYYLFENIEPNSIWKSSDYQFVYNYARDKKMDNISCESQSILINNDFNASSIAFLECAEFGSFQEKIIVTYIDGREYEFIADFSDFFQTSIYNEKVFWTGTALNRKNNKTITHNFSARIFAKRYSIPQGIVTSIKLPNKKNVHIFAITLEQ